MVGRPSGCIWSVVATPGRSTCHLGGFGRYVLVVVVVVLLLLLLLVVVVVLSGFYYYYY